ncbi:hypothetical protein [Pseudomonas anguilliseptica]|uniref:hypothetical protein n=1 Tax=Pseudomonas anguilliseptica TaxID=53406 RepID=UPI0022AEAEA3|nr:hypothetical protein [Pseudomonas anguilliseptica]MCZ4322681.1 hypothetical protein [Pseudomonas anguilliseptica]
MLIRNLSFLLILASGLSHAMSTENLPEDTLKAYGQSLASGAGSSQWQQLWQRTRAAGYFNQDGVQARFTLPMKEIPELVSSTLRDAHSVQPDKGTQALYRRDFAPRVVGTEGPQPLTAICLKVDWRSLPDHTQVTDSAQMGSVSLLLAQPCQ